eukprot:8289248-Prorocentrum_lima.AAC.1
MVSSRPTQQSTCGKTGRNIVQETCIHKNLLDKPCLYKLALPPRTTPASVSCIDVKLVIEAAVKLPNESAVAVEVVAAEDDL